MSKIGKRSSKKKSGFTMVDNAVGRYTNLSYTAKGIYLWIAGHDDEFDISVDNARRCGVGGRTLIENAYRELRTFGLIRLVRKRHNNGTFESWYEVRISIDSEWDELGANESVVEPPPAKEDGRLAGAAKARMKVDGKADSGAPEGGLNGLDQDPDFSDPEPEPSFPGSGGPGSGFPGAGVEAPKKKTNVEDQGEERENLFPESGDSAGVGSARSPFDAWWEDVVPAGHKLDRFVAERAFKSAVKRGATPEQLGTFGAYVMAALAARNGDRSKVKHPATWLNAGSWADDALPASGAQQQADVFDALRARYLAEETTARLEQGATRKAVSA